MDEAHANRPLSDVTVIDFGQIFQGPYATLLMAKAGAFVIKIEPPRGEPGRRRADPGKSATLPFAMLNQNKHAVTLNLKEPRGRELLFRMVRTRRCASRKFRPRHDGPPRRRLEPAARDQPAARLRDRHRLRHQRPRPRQSVDGFHDPGRLGDHERHRLSRRPAGQGRPDARRFHGRHPPLCRGPDRTLRPRPQRCRPARRGRDGGDRLFGPRRQLRLLLPHREDAAAHRQPPGRAQQRALQRLPDQ